MNKLKDFYNEHKVVINVVAGTVCVGVIAYLGYKYLPTNTKTQVKNTFTTVVPETIEAANIVGKELPYRELRENLNGITLSPRRLGNEALTTAQKINKKLIEAGLQTKQPNGEYIMTDLGRAFGKDTWKVTREGHSFSNIEWDTKVLEILYSKEELAEFKRINDYWNAYYAA